VVATAESAAALIALIGCDGLAGGDWMRLPRGKHPNDCDPEKREDRVHSWEMPKQLAAVPDDPDDVPLDQTPPQVDMYGQGEGEDDDSDHDDSVL
jgi:hypothetical protein